MIKSPTFSEVAFDIGGQGDQCVLLGFFASFIKQFKSELK